MPKPPMPDTLFATRRWCHESPVPCHESPVPDTLFALHSNFVPCDDREIGFFEAWVSVLDEELNWKSR